MRVGAPIAVAVLLGILLPAPGGADRADTRRAETASAEAGQDPTTAYLRLTRRALALHGERHAAQRALGATRRSLAHAERRLAGRLRLLYEVGRPDAVEVLLGARSLDDALLGLEGLQRIGREEAEQVADLRRARADLRTIVRRLRAQEREAARLREQAAAVLRTVRVQVATAPRPAEPAPSAPEPGQAEETRHSLTVVALGYSIPGTTASGLPAGIGTVAVDPSVVPLGSSLTIPGYGNGVAADTGAHIRGATIDLWFPTAAQARAWGRRVVTIRLASA